MRYRTPESRKRQYLDDAVALVIVHATKEWDWDEVSKKPIQSLIDRNGFVDYVYEFTTNHTSFVNHNGTSIDNNAGLGNYHIGNLAGNDYIVVGGKLGECHLGAFVGILASRFGLSKTRVHLPADSIYTQEEDEDGIKSSQIVTPDNPEFRNYESIVRSVFKNMGYGLYRDGKRKNSKGDKLMQVMLWSESEMMLEYIGVGK